MISDFNLLKGLFVLFTDCFVWVNEWFTAITVSAAFVRILGGVVLIIKFWMAGIKSFCDYALVFFHLASFCDIRHVINSGSLRIVMSSRSRSKLFLFISDLYLLFVFSSYLVEVIELLFFNFVFFPDRFFIKINTCFEF